MPNQFHGILARDTFTVVHVKGFDSLCHGENILVPHHTFGNGLVFWQNGLASLHHLEHRHLFARRPRQANGILLVPPRRTGIHSHRFVRGRIESRVARVVHSLDLIHVALVGASLLVPFLEQFNGFLGSTHVPGIKEHLRSGDSIAQCNHVILFGRMLGYANLQIGNPPGFKRGNGSTAMTTAVGCEEGNSAHRTNSKIVRV
mmetsp:Transcript_4144/g.8561  ORF Transcript_4144/g.8561 Transcript_4144/m.8561 type:complete len:202 (+) Transcript_4144:1369-1974(+)